MKQETTAMKLTHHFEGSPLKGTFTLTDDDEVILETRGLLTLVRELNRRGLRLPAIDPDRQWTVDLDPVASAAATLGRRGGSAKSPEKQAAARENGKRGGRPRGQFRLILTGPAIDNDGNAIRYRVFHPTEDHAHAEFSRIWPKLTRRTGGVVYGPGLGNIGRPA